MARECEICGKRPQVGNQVETRGKAKYLGGVGTKITGITKRLFSPNLQRVRVTLPSGAPKRLRVCTQCIRSGAIVKAIRSAPFRLPEDAKKAAAAPAKGAAKGAATKATATKPTATKPTATKEAPAKGAAPKGTPKKK
jgi:large subunit ribosomal protein L28